jgi:hypothetical protein
LPADSNHYFAANVLNDSVDGSVDTNRFLGPTLEALYLLAAVPPLPLPIPDFSCVNQV